jgi:predicted nucleic acid-binding protein
VYVILDANAIIRDYWLEGRATRRLLSQVEDVEGDEVTVLVPEVVLLEVVKHYRGDLQKAAEALNAADNKAARVLPDLQRSVPVNLDAKVREYEQHLRGRLGDAGVRIVSPQTSHGEMAARAVGRHKPFKSSGAGYQDALIWEVVRESARENNVALISNNHTDFGGDERGGLDQYLIDEIEGVGAAYEVERFPSIAAFNKEYLAHAPAFKVELAERLEDEGYRATVENDVIDAVVEQGPRELDPMGSIDDATTRTVTRVSIRSVELDEVNEATGDTFYATFHVAGEIELEFPMLQSEGWAEYEEGVLEDFSTDDSDEAFGTAVLMTPFELDMDADYDPEAGALTNFEIVSAVQIGP